jgi:ParB family transcriptional regulator, chromosome partitioning protein
MTQMVKKTLSWFKTRPQARKRFDEQELRQLGESLRVRQLQPVVCLPDGMIIAGERRYRAAMLVGMAELDVSVIDDPVTEAEFRRLQLTENLLREDLTGYEQWQGCLELLRLNPGWSQRDLAGSLRIDPSMAMRLLSPSKCVASVQSALAEGRIGISDTYQISRLPPAEQEEALAMKLSGASRDQLASHARRQKNGDKPSVRISRVKCELGGGVSIVVTGNALGLDEVIEALGDARKAACQGRDQNLDVKTWSAVMRDRSRNGS